MAGRADADRAYTAAGPATVDKILFTSGSTGAPKGVPNTQGMLCSAIGAAGLEFPVDAPPVTVDWMPWHHTLGGNSTLHSICATAARCTSTAVARPIDDRYEIRARGANVFPGISGAPI